MSKLLEEVKRAGVFYIATVDGDVPHVRPFGAIEEIDGKIYLVTGNNKAVFRQFIANPKVEFATSFSSSFVFVTIGYPLVWIVTTLAMAVYWLRYSKFLFKAEDYISNRNLI